MEELNFDYVMSNVYRYLCNRLDALDCLDEHEKLALDGYTNHEQIENFKQAIDMIVNKEIENALELF